MKEEANRDYKKEIEMFLESNYEELSRSGEKTKDITHLPDERIFLLKNNKTFNTSVYSSLRERSMSVIVVSNGSVNSIFFSDYSFGRKMSKDNYCEFLTRVKRTDIYINLTIFVHLIDDVNLVKIRNLRTFYTDLCTCDIGFTKKLVSIRRPDHPRLIFQLYDVFDFVGRITNEYYSMSPEQIKSEVALFLNTGRESDEYI